MIQIYRPDWQCLVDCDLSLTVIAAELTDISINFPWFLYVCEPNIELDDIDQDINATTPKMLSKYLL